MLQVVLVDVGIRADKIQGKWEWDGNEKRERPVENA